MPNKGKHARDGTGGGSLALSTDCRARCCLRHSGANATFDVLRLASPTFPGQGRQRAALGQGDSIEHRSGLEHGWEHLGLSPLRTTSSSTTFLGCTHTRLRIPIRG
eukprot:6474942-Prymnesium_polylepis.1